MRQPMTDARIAAASKEQAECAALAVARRMLLDAWMRRIACLLAAHGWCSGSPLEPHLAQSIWTDSAHSSIELEGIIKRPN